MWALNNLTPSVRKTVGAAAIVAAFVMLTGLPMVALRSARMGAVARYVRDASSLPAPGMEAPPHGRVAASVGEEVARRDAEMQAGHLRHIASQAPRLAQVKSYAAEIDLTPKLTVGADRTESIYRMRFHAAVAAVAPDDANGVCEVHLPLPPQRLSLADLAVTVNGKPSEAVDVRGDRLVWRGPLEARQAAELDVTYSADGKGVYSLQPPPGRIISTFDVTLTAHRSDIRMLQLALQPDKVERVAGATTYTWKYRNLFFGRPIVLDVLGITPVDQLGELMWLAPVGVLAFGAMVALVAVAFQPEMLDKWMLLLVVGAFAGAYPLMYFAQDLLPLGQAMAAASAAVLAVLAIRGLTLRGCRRAMLGIVGLGAAVHALTLTAAVRPDTQGTLVTALAVAAVMMAMMLLPRARRARPPVAPTAAPVPAAGLP